MSDSAWEKLGKELTSPWDWVAAGLGAVGGAVVTIATHGVDLGTSIPTGALAGVTGRKAFSASRTRARLAKSYAAIVEELNRIVRDVPISSLRFQPLHNALDSNMRLWQAHGISNEQFAKVLDDAVAGITAFWQASPPPAVGVFYEKGPVKT